MRTYETIIVLDPDLSDEDIENIIKKIEGVIESQKGEIVLVDHWGKRKLAYRVRKKFKGNYYRFVYYGLGSIVTVLERNLRITENVFKFLTVKISDVEVEEDGTTEEKPSIPDEIDGDKPRASDADIDGIIDEDDVGISDDETIIDSPDLKED